MISEIEMLESRLCLSAAVTPGATLSSSGVLFVVGDRNAANTISVKLSSDGTQIDTAVGSDTDSFAPADVKRVVVMGGDQADSINVDLTDANLNFSTVIIGRAGDDTISGGGENDVIWGRAGDDVIDAGGGNDKVFGGDGDDVITGGAGDDKLYGGFGDDTIDGGDGNDVLVGGDGAARLSGAAGDDTLVGDSDEGDVLDGGDGTNDVRDLADSSGEYGGGTGGGHCGGYGYGGYRHR